MPRNKGPIDIGDIDFSNLDLPGEVARNANKGKKKPPVKPITKTALRKMFESINAAFMLTGHMELALQDVELDTLAEAWHDVIALYPQIGSMIASGNRLTVWGNALFATFIILERRRAIFAQNPAGSTRHAGGDDGQRQDNAGPAPVEFPGVRASGGH